MEIVRVNFLKYLQNTDSQNLKKTNANQEQMNKKG